MFYSIFNDFNSDSWFDGIQYVGENRCFIRYLNFKDYSSWKKPAIYKRKLEIATRSSYTWVKQTSELWGFGNIGSHVTLHVKADAQKVN